MVEANWFRVQHKSVFFDFVEVREKRNMNVKKTNWWDFSSKISEGQVDEQVDGTTVSALRKWWDHIRYFHPGPATFVRVQALLIAGLCFYTYSISIIVSRLLGGETNFFWTMLSSGLWWLLFLS
ncbi:MAG: hypothetical protein ACRDD1_12110, partial [Planctomycetia bacterium]